MSDYTRERWTYIKALSVRPVVFHNVGTLRYPKRIHGPLGLIIVEDTKHFAPHETAKPRVRI